MLIMILELLAVGFILGMGITAVVLAGLAGVDVLVRAKHSFAPRVTEIGQFGRRPVGALASPRGLVGPGQRRAA